MGRFVAFLALLAGVGLSGVAHASFHQTFVREVYTGGERAGPDAQYVVLQMYAADQNFVGGHRVNFFDAADNLVHVAIFPADVQNGAAGSTILLATQAAQTYFGVTADLTLTGRFLDPATGKVCFEALDCVKWGQIVCYEDYYDPSAEICDREFGITPSLALQRTRLTNGEFDTIVRDPAPRNNAGVTGAPPNIVVTNFASAGSGSLAAAITLANTDRARDSIRFQPGLRGTLDLTEALPPITRRLDLFGPGADELSIRWAGSSAERVLTIDGAGTGSYQLDVTVSGLTLENGGGPVGTVPVAEGGCIRAAGGLTTLRDVTLRGCRARSGGCAAGVGIIERSRLLGCTASGGAPSSPSRGGALFGGFRVSDTLIQGNVAAVGGAIFVGSGNYLTLDRGAVVGNQTLAGATVVTGRGVIRSTIFAGNTAPGDAASAVSFTGGSSSGSTSKIIGSTFTGNAGGPLVEIASGVLEIVNTFLDAPSVPYCRYLGAAGSPIISYGHNLSTASSRGGDDECSLLHPTDLASSQPVSELLGPLAADGSYSPSAHSAVVNAGSNAGIVPGHASFGVGDYDRRGAGFPRISGGTVDIGAIEVAAVPPDAGVAAADAGVVAADAGVVVADAGVVAADAGVVAVDGGVVAADAGVVVADGGGFVPPRGGCAIREVRHDLGDTSLIALLLASACLARRGRRRSASPRAT